MSRENDIRQLAEWLDWTVFPDGFGGYRMQEDLHDRIKPIPDFYTSEEANALLLEKMPHAMVYHSTTGEWRCRSNHPSGDWEMLRKDPDRKTAIVKAALALIEKEKQ